MFDKQAFMTRSFIPRKGVVSVPDMKAFFPKDAACDWTVRGLTADELSSCNEAADKMKSVGAIVDAMTGGSDKEKAEAIKEILGIDIELHPDTIKRMEMLVFASVDIEVDLPLAVKLSEVYPIEFFSITNKISELTGQGQEVGK